MGYTKATTAKAWPRRSQRRGSHNCVPVRDEMLSAELCMKAASHWLPGAVPLNINTGVAGFSAITVRATARDVGKPAEVFGVDAS